MTFFFPCDLPVAEAMAQWRTLGGTYFFINLSEVAGPTASAGLTLMIGLALLLRRRFAAIAGLAVAVGGANAAWVVIKQLIERPRPDVSLASFIEPGYSFPSGHATNAFALVVFFSLFFWECLPKSRARTALVVALIACAALIAFGRVYLGVHYVSDVVAGAALGTLFGYLGHRVSRGVASRKR